jgi:pullulanase/glycogen debranching enzyme
MARSPTSRCSLARRLYDVDRLSAFFDIIHEDPILSVVKLIAEPPDVGPSGHQVGNFPIQACRDMHLDDVAPAHKTPRTALQQHVRGHQPNA